MGKGQAGFLRQPVGEFGPPPGLKLGFRVCGFQVALLMTTPPRGSRKVLSQALGELRLGGEGSGFVQ